VVAVWTVPLQHPDQVDNVSVQDFLAWRDENRSFEAMGSMVDNTRDFGAEENGLPAYARLVLRPDFVRTVGRPGAPCYSLGYCGS